jgi:hypothetical protein
MGSGRTSRLSATLRLGIDQFLGKLLACSGLRPFRSILRPSLFAIRYTHRIKGSANHVIANSRQVFHTPSSNQNNRVLLEVMAYAGNISCDLNAVGQPDARDFTQCRIRFLWGLCIDTRAYTSFLRRALEGRTGCLVLNSLAAFANKLIYCRQRLPLFLLICSIRVCRNCPLSERKKALPASFRNQSGSQRRRLPCI